MSPEIPSRYNTNIKARNTKTVPKSGCFNIRIIGMNIIAAIQILDSIRVTEALIVDRYFANIKLTLILANSAG